MKVSRCRSCSAPIIWARMKPSGSPMPFDAAPSPAGAWAIDDRTTPATAGRIDSLAGPNAMGLTSHFATCPFAREYRKHRKEKVRP